MDARLANLVWHALSGEQRHLTTGTERARRLAPGFSPIIACADPRGDALADLTPFCAPGQHFYCADWSGPIAAGWQLEEESTMHRMVWAGAAAPADPAPEALPLGAGHAPAALALAELTRPGPFGPRTIELGEFFGIFDSGRLVAMAGERFHAGPYREVSGVCTHPDFQGRGLARRLMEKIIGRQRRRGQTPFLHVMHDNERAAALYRRMGFVSAGEVTVRVVSPPAVAPTPGPTPPPA